MLLAAVLLLCASLCASGASSHASSPPAPSLPPRLTVNVCRLLYCATVVNPVISVIANEYRSVDFPSGKMSMRGRFLPSPLRTHSSDQSPTAAVYRTLFYFARLKPRLLFVVGACLRALQQTTVIQLVFDPTIGVGAGLNLLALATDSRWPSALLLGWTCSKPYWLCLRAAPPAQVQVPISINWNRKREQQ